VYTGSVPRRPNAKAVGVNVLILVDAALPRSRNRLEKAGDALGKFFIAPQVVD